LKILLNILYTALIVTVMWFFGKMLYVLIIAFPR